MKFIKEKYITLDILEKQKYITFIKDTFRKKLSYALKLTPVSAPMIVTRESGLQDDLCGVERVVAFDTLKDKKEVEIVQSLAKWKRMALKKYGVAIHKGIVTDMRAIRRDDKMDETHSIFVDQWDWEKVITKKDRSFDYLKQTVSKIVKAICETQTKLQQFGFTGTAPICSEVKFITAQELLDMFPDKTAKEREYLITKQYKTVFIMQIGDKLSDGTVHDFRAPDYDDWSLDGDLFIYHEVLDMALEISSMGIRVDKKALLEQTAKAKTEDRLKYTFHKMILSEDLPLSIGGGIGQSRLCELLLGRAHIGETQASYWDSDTIHECSQLAIELL